MSYISSQYISSFLNTDENRFSLSGGKAQNLISLSKQGMPIPEGYVINTLSYQYFLKNRSLPEGLVKDILFIKKQLGGKIVIRSSANLEDQEDLSMAGVFLSKYVYEDEQVEKVIKRIYLQSRSKPVEDFLALHGKSTQSVQMALIVQKLVEPEYSGVIYTGINKDKILVQYIDGLGERLVNEAVSGSAFLLNKKGTITESLGFETRPLSEKIIADILKNVQRIEFFSPGSPQDIEFAYKGDDFYLLQVRTLTTDLGHVELKQSPAGSLEETKEYIKKLIEKEKSEMGIQTAIFSDSNYSELLPKPAPMDIGIYQYISGGSDGVFGATQIGRLEMGYKVGKEALGIIHYIGGRTYFSIARNAAIYHIGFPETKKEYFQVLVNEYLSAIESDPEKGAYPQMGLYLQDPTLEDLEKRFGQRAQEYFSIYLNFAENMKKIARTFLSQFQEKELPLIESFTKEMSLVHLEDFSNEELVTQLIKILEHVRTKTYVDFVKAARLGFYYSQRLRNLFSDEIYSQLNQGLDGSAITDSNREIASAKTVKEALQIAREKIGHFSTGEMLEIRHKPLKESPKKLLAYVKGIRETKSYGDDFEKQKKARLRTQEEVLNGFFGKEKKEIAEIINSSQSYMALRETVKYLFTKEYVLIRDILEALEKRLSLRESDIYYLYPRELSRFVEHPDKMLHLIQARKQFFFNAEGFDFPSIISESNLNTLSLREEKEHDFTELQGKFLAEGQKIEGVIVNTDEFSSLEKVTSLIKKYRKEGKSIILVAKQMNLSHDPLIVQSAGLVIENAGLVAHGAQRARELGKGAIGGIKSSLLKTGTIVIFDPQQRKVKKGKQ